MKYGMLFLSIILLSFSLFAEVEPISVKNLIIQKMQQNFKAGQYSKALAMAKYFRENLLSKNQLYYDQRPILLEAFILKKLCYHEQSNQVIEYGKAIANSLNLSSKVFEEGQNKLVYLELGKSWESFDKGSDFKKDISHYPINTSMNIDVKFFEYIDIELESKC